jgi:hypothetical protein
MGETNHAKQPGARYRSRGERELLETLMREPVVRQAIARHRDSEAVLGARRQLLGTSLRLTEDMAPDVATVLRACRDTLGLIGELETYVYPGSTYNAAAVRPEGGRLFVMLSSSLLDSFDNDELRFVIGHELAHHLFDHHDIPLRELLSPGPAGVAPGVALRMFAWQRYAEISCDRAGLACAGDLQAAGRALFKLASGLSGQRVRFRVDQFLSQASDLRAENERAARGDAPPRSDWFSTHPFSPLRLVAVQLAAESDLFRAQGRLLDEVEAEIHEIMRVMEPGYLQERSAEAEAMRRLLFAGGVAIAAASGNVDPKGLEALEELMGSGSVSSALKVDTVVADLDRRAQAVREHVAPLRRSQVMHDLCIVARASGNVSEAELTVMIRIAEAIEVDTNVVVCTTCEAPGLD